MAYNAKRLGVADRVDVRLVAPDDPGAYSPIKPNERFDIVVANPPWENRAPKDLKEHALYDSGFSFLHSILDGLHDHLKPNGRAFLIYGSAEAVRTLVREAAQRGLRARRLDERDPDTLRDVFLPGMAIEVRP